MEHGSNVEVPLTGGNATTGVVRIGNTVRRPATTASVAVDAFLRHLNDVGYTGAPRTFGFDEQGRHVVEYVQGPLSSFWRCESLSKTSGTPVEWLPRLSDTAVVEVFCECPPRLAADRWVARQRHPGHFDDRKTAAELVPQFEQLTAAGRLGIGPLLRVDTTTKVDVEGLAQAVHRSVG